MKTQKYFEDLKLEVDKVYEMANSARARGFDPVKNVEIPLAMSMAEKAVGLISTLYPQMKDSGISERILELEKDYGKLDTTVVFKIAEEVAKQKFCSFKDTLESMDAGIRIGFAYLTLAVVSSPIEGFTGLKIRKTYDGKEYIEASFAGPIRSAGTTASCIVLMLIDYLREMFGFEKYDPTEDEIKRVYAELEHFHDRITNLQYMPTEEEALFLARHMPIQVAGDASEKIEVPNYKNLERVDTDYLRSGFCLIMAEGLAQKAAKGFRLFNNAKKKGINASGFDWLSEYIKLHEKRNKGKAKSSDSPTYIKDLVAGRPIFGHPGKSGSFRFRYGRGRNSGFSASSVHPATMAITDNFIATGTQLKIEKPTKGCALTSCDSIDGPIVKLFNGSVKKINSKEEAEKVYKDVEEIIYLGDILFPFSDVVNRNYDLIKPGYVEEWWKLDLEKKGFKEEIDFYNVDFDRALGLSKNYSVPLHPKYIFYWTQISKEQFDEFVNWLKSAWINEKIIFPYTLKEQEKFGIGKRVLELLGIEHQVTTENVVLSEESSRALLVNLGLNSEWINKSNIFLKDILADKDFSGQNVLEVVDSLSEFKIKDKAGDFIGSRMGRPEKAKLRKLTGSPNVLFPVGNEGGRLRSVQEALNRGKVKSSFPIFYCESCNKQTIYPVCQNCNKKSKQMYYHFSTKEKSFDKFIQGEEKPGTPYQTFDLDIKEYFNYSVQNLGLNNGEIPDLIKGIRGTSSEHHIMEHLDKGILRARQGLQVNKDGTIRMDATELPLTYFKPSEIGTSVEKLKELGYDKDVYGNKLENEEQLLELMPHDVLIPSGKENPDEKGGEVFVKVSKFVDEELELFYKKNKFYNVKSKEDLIGKLGVSMAPHNCAGVICRFIGFSNVQGLYASPYMHAAIRRDCLGYNNYVSVKKNGRWKIEKIGKFIEDSNPSEKADNFGTLTRRMENVSTWSNPGEKKVREITKHKPKKLIKIYSEDGRQIEVTENHKIYLKGKKERRAFQLQKGDQLMVNYKKEFSEKDINKIFLPDFFKDFKDREDVMLRNIRHYLGKFENLSKHENFWQRDSFHITFVEEFLRKHGKTLQDLPDNVKIAVKGDSVALPIRIPFDEKLLELIGLYISKGFLRKTNSEKGFYQISITATNEKVRQLIRKTFFLYFNLKPMEDHSDHLTFSSRMVYELFKNYFELGDSAKNKRISSLFLDLKKEKLAALLRGYFEGDGSVSLTDTKIVCDTVSEGLKHDLSFVLSRFDIFTKFYEYEKEPGPKLREFYAGKNRKIPKFKITKIIIPSNFVKKFSQIGFISERKKSILNDLVQRTPRGMRIDFDKDYVYPKIIKIEEMGEEINYSFNVDEEHNFFTNDILVHNCDGDEAAIMLLGDVLLNFSKEYLPGHRGGTQDAPLVLNAKIDAGEVDDQILDFEASWNYPLELYEKAEKRMHSSEIKEIKTIKDIMKKNEDPFRKLGFTHNVSSINSGVVCSAYKLLGTMQEKVGHQMELVEKLRSVDTSDTARLIIERHFLRDLKGNLRKFSQQDFRCVNCNEILRRPPLNGKCPVCGGKLIFTIHEGGIKKYLEPALDLGKKYHLSKYLNQSLDLVKSYVDSIFGKELEKQTGLREYF